jgi:hypothetical protein
MRSRGPILTLLSMTCLAIALLAVNMRAGSKLVAETAAPAVTGAAPQAATPAPAALPATGSYNGLTTGRKAGEATVAITIRNGQARAHVYDGKKLESSLEGRVEGTTMTLRGKGTNELTGELRDGKLTGTATIDGVRWPYTAAPDPAATAPAPSPRGGTQ